MNNLNKAMRIICYAVLSVIILSCNTGNQVSDAYGNFEAIEIIVTSQVQGEVIELDMEKGEQVCKGQMVGSIDTTSYHLQLNQLKAQKRMIQSKMSNILAEIKVQEEQKATLLIEKNRLENLLQDGAATPKQMDEVLGQLRLVESRINAIKTKNSTVLHEIDVIDSKIEIAREQLRKCKIINPVDGTVLEKYIEPFELVVPGKALYKVADLSKLDLHVYISGTQLVKCTIGDTVDVYIDKDEKTNDVLPGTIIWISDKAEFTPKIIQTKEERVNMVYAMLVRVKNNGRLKVGMPGEVVFK